MVTRLNVKGFHKISDDNHCHLVGVLHKHYVPGATATIWTTIWNF